MYPASSKRGKTSAWRSISREFGNQHIPDIETEYASQGPSHGPGVINLAINPTNRAPRGECLLTAASCGGIAPPSHSFERPDLTCFMPQASGIRGIFQQAPNASVTRGAAPHQQHRGRTQMTAEIDGTTCLCGTCSCAHSHYQPLRVSQIIYVLCWSIISKYATTSLPTALISAKI